MKEDQEFNHFSAMEPRKSRRHEKHGKRKRKGFGEGLAGRRGALRGAGPP
jgi:hypothetical protein